MKHPGSAAELDPNGVTSIQIPNALAVLMDVAIVKNPEYGWTGRTDMARDGIQLLLRCLGEMPSPDIPALTKWLKEYTAARAQGELPDWRYPGGRPQ